MFKNEYLGVDKTLHKIKDIYGQLQVYVATVEGML